MEKYLKIFRSLLNKKNQRFWNDFDHFKAISKSDKRFLISKDDIYPCLDDATQSTDFDAHYIYHTAWAARRIAAKNPSVHVDLSSYLYFATILSAFVPVKFYDYRPAKIRLSQLSIGRNDLTQLDLADNSIESLSCMHTVEHVGLGRYGDAIKPIGDMESMRELSRVLAPNGYLYFVVPIGGSPKICFNAHRIYSYRQIIEAFPSLQLVEFSLIPDNGIDIGIIENAEPSLAEKQHYGCGCFIFKK